MSRYYLGFDAGTQSVKVAVYDEHMQIVASSTSPTTLSYPHPGWDIKNATGCFLNMTMDTDQATMWHAVLEAIGYDYMEITDLYRSAGVNLNRITVTEGGSRSNVWNQIKADMLGSDIVTPENAEGAVATNCIVGAYAVGDIPDITEAVTANFKVKQTFHADESNKQFYREQYNLQKQIVKQDMSAVFDRLKEINNDLIR